MVMNTLKKLPMVDDATDFQVEEDHGATATGLTVVDDFPGDTSTTGQVAVGGAVIGDVQFNGDRDWFRVQLVADHTYAIDERGAASGGGTLSDPYVRLHDADRPRRRSGHRARLPPRVPGCPERHLL